MKYITDNYQTNNETITDINKHMKQRNNKLTTQVKQIT